MSKNPINWDIVFRGVSKQYAQQFVDGKLSSRNFIGKAKTLAAKKELYRLERNPVRDARRLTKNAIVRNSKKQTPSV